MINKTYIDNVIYSGNILESSPEIYILSNISKEHKNYIKKKIDILYVQNISLYDFNNIYNIGKEVLLCQG